jgi:DNA-binding MarR family transcriptional regulator
MTNASAKEVMVLVHSFGMSRDRLRSAMAALSGIGLTDIDALEYLERLGPLTQRDLGSQLQLTSGAVTMLVDRLEGLDLVRRGRHPTDRRATLVELVPDAALPELPELAAYHQRSLEAAQRLSPSGRAEIATFLQQLITRADECSEGMRARTMPRSRG